MLGQPKRSAQRTLPGYGDRARVSRPFSPAGGRRLHAKETKTVRTADPTGPIPAPRNQTIKTG